MLSWFKKIKRTHYSDEEWVKLLRRPPDEKAIHELREILRRGLINALASRIKRDREQIAEDYVQEALLKILDNLESYRYEARFTSWAMKIAIHEALTDLRRKHWKDISLNNLNGRDGSVPIIEVYSSEDPAPDYETGLRLMMQELQRIMEESLTEKQRLAITSVMVQGLPADQVAKLMGTNRNNMYKLIHDARMKIKHEFEKKGIELTDFLDKT